MDNKQIEEAVEVAKKLEVGLMMTPSKTGDEEDNLIKSADAVRQLISLAQLFLSIKGAPKKKEGITFHSGRQNSALSAYSPTDNQKIGYNLCHDEFTAYLAERMKGIEIYIYSLIVKIRNKDLSSIDAFMEEKKMARDFATAIKTMILGERD